MVAIRTSSIMHIFQKWHSILDGINKQHRDHSLPGDSIEGFYMCDKARILYSYPDRAIQIGITHRLTSRRNSLGISWTCRPPIHFHMISFQHDMSGIKGFHGEVFLSSFQLNRLIKLNHHCLPPCFFDRFTESHRRNESAYIGVSATELGSNLLIISTKLLVHTSLSSGWPQKTPWLRG